MAAPIDRYGVLWPGEATDLQIEIACIQNGGSWMIGKVPAGAGLFHHYRTMQSLLWPEDDHHRWSDLILSEILKNTITAILGPKDSSKTHTASKFALCDYYCFSEETLILISSTDLRGLEMRVWGDIKSLHERALNRHDGIPGHILESKHAICTDDLSDEAVVSRDMRKGILCIPCLSSSGQFTGISKYVGMKQKRRRLIADESQFMHASFLESLANLNAGDFKGVFMGNPLGQDDPLDKISEPKAGWTALPEPEKTATWDNRFLGGRTINLVGTDSPNFDEATKGRYHYLINQKSIDNVTAALDATNQTQFVTLKQLENSMQGGIVMYFDTTTRAAGAAAGFLLTGTVNGTNYMSRVGVPALWTNVAATSANGTYVAAFVSTNTYSSLSSGLAVVDVYAFENSAGSGEISAELYIINSVTKAEEYEFTPAPAFQTVFAGATPTKLTFSIPVTDYSSTTNFHVAVKLKVQESGVDPTIRIVTGGSYASHLSISLPSQSFVLKNNDSVTNLFTYGVTHNGPVTNTMLVASRFMTTSATKTNSTDAVASSVLADTLGDKTGSGSVVFSTSPTFTNVTVTGTLTATIDASTAGVTLKQTKYADFTHPHLADGVGAIIQTNNNALRGWGHATFSGTAETNANWVEYQWAVPTDIDTSVAMTAMLKCVTAGTDTDAWEFRIKMIDVADSADSSNTTFADSTTVQINSGALSNPAANDVFSKTVTLTNWAGAVTADHLLIIRLERLNNANDDAQTDRLLRIGYGSTQ